MSSMALAVSVMPFTTAMPPSAAPAATASGPSLPMAAPKPPNLPLVRLIFSVAPLVSISNTYLSLIVAISPLPF